MGNIKPFFIHTLIVLSWSMIIPELVYSQRAETVYKRLDISTGLPSSEVYCVIQDKEGYIWCSTDRGVARYNGYEFDVFTRQDGLTDEVVFRLYEDFKGRIWMLTSNGRLSYYYKGKIEEYKYNEKLEQQLLYSVKYCNSFYVNKRDELYYGSLGNGLIGISSDGRLLDVAHDEGNHWEVKKIGDRLLSSYYTSDIESIPVLFDIVYNKQLLAQSAGVPIRIETERLEEGMICFNTSNGVAIFDEIKDTLLEKIEFASRITFLKKHGQEIFVGVENDGLYVYQFQKAKKKLSLIRHDFLLKTPSYLLVDSNGGHWVSIIEEGLLYAPNTMVRSISKTTGLQTNYIKNLSVFEGKLCIDVGTAIHVLKEDGTIANFPQRKSSISANHNSIFLKDECYIYVRGDCIINTCTNSIYPSYSSQGILSIDHVDDKWMILTPSTLYEFGEDSFKETHLSESVKGIECAVNNGKNKYWIGTAAGLYRISQNESQYFGSIHPALSHRISTMAMSEKWGLVLGTRGKGVIFYNKGKIKVIDRKAGLVSNDIIRIFEASNHTVWVATNKGLHRIRPQENYAIDFYSHSDGLVSSEVTSIQELNGILYVGTKRGLSLLKINSSPTIIPNPKIRLTRLSLNRKDISPKKRLDIYPDDRQLKIEFLTLHYPAPELVEYRYRIKGLFNEWSYTKNRSISIETFPVNGTYQIEIQSRIGPNGKWSSHALSLHLIFHPPFYKTTSFFIICFLSITLLIYLGFRLRLLVYNKYIQQEIFNRILKLLGKKAYLTIQVDKKKLRINQSEIKFIQSHKDYCEIVTQKRKYLCRSTLKKMEERLPGIHFIRVNRSYLVRKDRIDAIATDHILVDGNKIPIGITYRKELKEFKSQFSRLNK